MIQAFLILAALATADPADRDTEAEHHAALWARENAADLRFDTRQVICRASSQRDDYRVECAFFPTDREMEARIFLCVTVRSPTSEHGCTFTDEDAATARLRAQILTMHALKRQGKDAVSIECYAFPTHDTCKVRTTDTDRLRICRRRGASGVTVCT